MLLSSENEFTATSPMSSSVVCSCTSLSIMKPKKKIKAFILFNNRNGICKVVIKNTLGKYLNYLGIACPFF